MSDSLPSNDPRLGDGTRAKTWENWPDGTTDDDHRCWVCLAPTEYRHCKIICTRCGFTRDCSDP